MDYWIPVTLLAALAQTARFTLQRQLKTTRLTSLGATFSRYIFSLPLAVIGALLYGAAIGVQVPLSSVVFWAYVVVAGGTQILATVCMMALFARRNFSVGIAFTKTTVLMAVPVGWVWLGDTTSWFGFAAIVLGFVGVLLLSDVPSDTGRGFVGRVLNMGTGFGMAAGLLFAVAGVGYRGAVLELGDIDPVLRALVTLACATVLQTAVMAVWMRWREPGEVSRVVAAWRISGLVGLASMIGSTCWFIAFTMQNVAYVNAVGQIELLFSLAVTVFFFKESISAREWQGGVLLTISILALILYA